ncbi:MAG: hypothetical protein OEY96_13845 [Gammaproteobacteria bacterium]|nr:hypothetical protein [Gammaproteobacteria bacterium]
MRKSFFRNFLVCFFILNLCACETLITDESFQVLHRYRSTDNYGGLSIKLEDTILSNQDAKPFLECAKNYALSRNIQLISENKVTPTDSVILIHRKKQNNKRFRIVATLLREGRQIDQIKIPVLNKENAELMIDEMLLIWHPLNSEKITERMMPNYSLKPIFYKVGAHGFFEGFSGTGKREKPINVGWQVWYELDSLKPVFTWQSFPRGIDLHNGLTEDSFKNIRYHFKLYPVFHNIFIKDEEKREVTNDKYTVVNDNKFVVTKKLIPCTLYIWSVRAVFELNGVTRQTEWSGINTVLGPWMYRREISVFMAMQFHPSHFYYRVATPIGPFIEDCVYH